MIDEFKVFWYSSINSKRNTTMERMINHDEKMQLEILKKLIQESNKFNEANKK